MAAPSEAQRNSDLMDSIAEVKPDILLLADYLAEAGGVSSTTLGKPFGLCNDVIAHTPNAIECLHAIWLELVQLARPTTIRHLRIKQALTTKHNRCRRNIALSRISKLISRTYLALTGNYLSLEHFKPTHYLAISLAACWNDPPECPPPLRNEGWQPDHAPFHGYRNTMRGAVRMFPGVDAAHHCWARSLVVSTYERISRRDGAQYPPFHDHFSSPASPKRAGSAVTSAAG
jgi:hypothetical protein